MEWSSYQSDIFDALTNTEDNLIVQAVAGSGKSTTIMECVRLLARTKKHRQLILSFNQEIAKSATKKLGSDSETKQYLNDGTVKVSTFHSYGLEVLKQASFFSKYHSRIDPNKLGDFLFKGTMVPQEIKGHFYGLISNIMGHGVMTTDPEQLGTFFKSNWFSLLSANCDRDDARAIAKRMDLLSRCIRQLDADKSRLSFDDMVRFPLIYGCFKTVSSLVIPTVLYVDEAQDCNGYMIGFIKQMVARGARVIAVGDRHQAIYAFRGAYADSMDKVQRITQARELPLSISYRCHSRIVDYCLKDYDRLIALASDEDIIEVPDIKPLTQGGRVLKFAPCLDDMYRIDDLVSHKVQMVVSPKNKHLIPILIGLFQRDVACTVKGAKITGSIKSTMRELQRGGSSFDQAVRRLKSRIKDPNTKEVHRDVMETCVSLIEGFKLKTYAGLECKLKELDKQKKGIQLHSVHSSKGLEADNVAVLASEFFGEQMQNTRYVAFTRASKLLLVIRLPKKKKVN